MLGALITCASEKSQSDNCSALLIYTSNKGCLNIASFRISFINLASSICTFGALMINCVPSLLRGVSLTSLSSELPVNRLSKESESIIMHLLKFPCLVLIFIRSKEVRNDNLPVPYLPVLTRLNLGEIDSILLCGEPKSKNLSTPFLSIPASSSMQTDPSFKIVIKTFVASSSNAFSTSSFTTSPGDTQVLVANSLKNEG